MASTLRVLGLFEQQHGLLDVVEPAIQVEVDAIIGRVQNWQGRCDGARCL